MWKRIFLIARTHLAGEWLGERGARLPVAPILFQASLAAVLCGLVRDELTPHAYGVFALSIPMGLAAIALLGELGPLLRADPAAEWVCALPVKPVELRAARVLVLGVLLCGLALGSLVPAAILAPADLDLFGRLVLILGGLLLVLFIGALLLWVQVALAERAEGLLAGFQTVLFCLVIVGLTAGLGYIQELNSLAATGSLPLTYPPVWFAAPLNPESTSAGWPLALGAIAVSLVTFALAPFPPAPRAHRTRSPLGVLLTPLRWIALRTWVRKKERASFEWVYDALPAETDFVTRAYPLLAIPLAFLLLGADGTQAADEGLLALLLFAPAVYLPLLLMYVPATATPDARWIVDTCPVDPRDESAGARKALAVRLLAPLYLTLGALVAWQANLDLALLLTPVASAAGLLLLRASWSFFSGAPPLSTAPSDLGTAWDDSRSGRMFMIAIMAALSAIASWQLIDAKLVAFSILAGALVIEWMPRSSAVLLETAEGPPEGNN